MKQCCQELHSNPNTKSGNTSRSNFLCRTSAPIQCMVYIPNNQAQQINMWVRNSNCGLGDPMHPTGTQANWIGLGPGGIVFRRLLLLPNLAKWVSSTPQGGGCVNRPRRLVSGPPCPGSPILSPGPSFMQFSVTGFLVSNSRCCVSSVPTW